MKHPLFRLSALATALLLPIAAIAAAPKAATPGIAAYLSIDINAPLNYARPALPRHYDAALLAQTNTPRDNPVTDKGATLGRVLFYDARLSLNNSTSCASCHVQSQGFGAATVVSKGLFGVAGTRHSMRLGNVAFYRGNAMFWDRRAASLEAQSLQPIQNSIEMGYDIGNGGLPALLIKMQTLPYYPELFAAVYGDPAITADRMQRALSQFMRSMISANSRWDQAYARNWNPALADRGLSLNLPGFSAQENRGKDLFMTGAAQRGPPCAACHRPPSFALAPDAKSNGLDAGETTVFKAPSLKNITQGQPMMHDGRFTSLEQVIGHYNLGVKPGPALDPRLSGRNGQPVILNLTTQDQAALVAFLKTLEDSSLKADPRYANPFRN